MGFLSKGDTLKWDEAKNSDGARKPEPPIADRPSETTLDETTPILETELTPLKKRVGLSFPPDPDAVNNPLWSSLGFKLASAAQRTSAEGVYALGDVCGKVALTPVAIAAGRRLADRLFGNQPGAKLDYENVPSVVFSHPPLATVGLTEQQAVTQFGREAIKVYSARFNNLYYAPSERKVPTLMKLVTMGLEERIVGMHVLGLGADEMIQGFAVAVHMGARKRDLDDTVAIHPTAAEEFVTMR